MSHLIHHIPAASYPRWLRHWESTCNRKHCCVVRLLTVDPGPGPGVYLLEAERPYKVVHKPKKTGCEFDVKPKGHGARAASGRAAAAPGQFEDYCTCEEIVILPCPAPQIPDCTTFECVSPPPPKKKPKPK